MAKKKLTPQAKLERIEKIIYNIFGDIMSNKPSAELFSIIQNDLTQCMAVIKSDVDDDMVIAKLWVETERGLLIERGIAKGAYTQLTLGEAGKKTDGK